MSREQCEHLNCKREKWKKDKKYCIFHSKKCEEKESEFVEKFESEFPEGFIQKKENIIVDALFSGDNDNYILNFEGFIFPKSNFIEKIFSDTQIEYDISFFKTTFLGPIFFSRTTFLKKVSFAGAIFSCNVFFSSAEFKDDVVFSSAVFEKSCSYRMTKFKDMVSFTKSNFQGEVYLTGAEFSKSSSVSFKNSKFLSDLYFGEAIFATKIIFDYSKFLGEVDLSNVSAISGSVSFKNCKFEDYVDLSIKNCEYINLEAAMNHGIINFNTQRKENLNIKRLNFFNIKNLGHIYIDWNNVKEAIENFSADSINKVNQYRILKENFHRLGKYEDEDKAYLEFRRNKLLTERDKLNWPIKIKYYLKKFALEIIGDFGTNPLKIAISMVGFVLFFSVVYSFFSLLGYPLIGGENLMNNFIYSNEIVKSTYHSIVTFLTIGYGDLHPLNFLGMILSGIEGFLGLFLMSYFTVSFVRKVLR